MINYLLLNGLILSFIYLYIRTMRTCKLCNTKFDGSEFKDVINKKSGKKTYGQTCSECSEEAEWFKKTWGGVYAYQFHHTKEEIEVQLERIRQITGVRNGEELLAKHRAKRIKNDL